MVHEHKAEEQRHAFTTGFHVEVDNSGYTIYYQERPFIIVRRNHKLPRGFLFHIAAHIFLSLTGKRTELWDRFALDRNSAAKDELTHFSFVDVNDISAKIAIETLRPDAGALTQATEWAEGYEP